jgi:hypothetical protein
VASIVGVTSSRLVIGRGDLGVVRSTLKDVTRLVRLNVCEALAGDALLDAQGCAPPFTFDCRHYLIVLTLDGFARDLDVMRDEMRARDTLSLRCHGRPPRLSIEVRAYAWKSTFFSCLTTTYSAQTGFHIQAKGSGESSRISVQ